MNPTIPTRIWRRDHTLWSDDPTEITNRLGWLDAPQTMLPHLDDLDDFAREIRADGITRAVLLGMGGSSLAPEVLSQCLDYSIDGASLVDDRNRPYPKLTVLDSTIPARIRTVTDSIDPARTLFIVSSKSGTTIEPNALYRHFRRIVEDAAKEAGEPDRAGSRFIAITDAGTPLDDLAQRHDFRRVFRNPPDIGGRYSALSYFGLVPAALIGFDHRCLIQSAAEVRAACRPDVPLSNNPGATLGAFIAQNALAGRDKLTILTSPALASFGLWAEQLVAESLGKNGRGVIPITGESPAAFQRVPDHYPDRLMSDRQFIYLKLIGSSSETDALADRLAPLFPIPYLLPPISYLRTPISSISDLGGEFFRWQFATATAGALLGVHPFDQPNVQRAKDLADRALRQFQTDGIPPAIQPQSSLTELLDAAKPGDYLAILAYVEQTPETDAIFANLRAEITAKYNIPTTLGYGPRYLHSTGQLHKGGPNNILALIVTDTHQSLPIPSAPHDFATLATAQAAADITALTDANRRIAVTTLALMKQSLPP